METVVHDGTPLADYLIGEGEADQSDWATAEQELGSSLPPSSPGFAPKGRPTVSSRFRTRTPDPLRLNVPTRSPLGRLKSRYSSAVASRIDQSDNTKFLDQFRYTIVASQLLSPHPGISAQGLSSNAGNSTTPAPGNDEPPPGPEVLFSAAGAIGIAFVVAWLIAGGWENLTKKRVVFLAVTLVAVALIAPVYFKSQWLRYRREQALSGINSFVSSSQHFDSAAWAAISLIQEVELVSRGYRISAPLPPISRIEERSQTRKCVRLRKALRTSLAEVIETYGQASLVAKGFSEQLDLEKYYDIYDVSDADIAEALQGYSEDKFDDLDSLMTLKILAARFHTIRRILLCALITLDANRDSRDLLRWTMVVEALQNLTKSTNVAYERVKGILTEESFGAPPTPKAPLTPGRERFRSQMRKLNSLSTGIRGLQAKLQLLREESDRVLDSSTDVTELGPGLVTQYESIGVDLRELMGAWEEGKAALALGIDRNEKRLSSMSTLLSPTTSLSGLTTVEESNAHDALRILNGDKDSSRSPSSVGFSSGDPEAEEIFEAVAIPRPRSLLTREERIIKMREERERRAEAKDKAEATRGMMKELEMVINLRPRGSRKSTARVASL